MAAPTPRSSGRVFGKQRAQLSAAKWFLQSGGGWGRWIAEVLFSFPFWAPLLPPNAVGSRRWNWHPTSRFRVRPPASFGPRAVRFATSSGGRTASPRVSPQRPRTPLPNNPRDLRSRRARTPLPNNPRDLRSRRARTPRSLRCPPDRPSDSVRLRKPCALHPRIDWRRWSIPDSRASWLPRASWRSD
jgi:hypothetical protein